MLSEILLSKDFCGFESLTGSKDPDKIAEEIHGQLHGQLFNLGNQLSVVANLRSFSTGIHHHLPNLLHDLILCCMTFKRLKTVVHKCATTYHTTLKLESSFCKALNTVEARFSRKIGHRTFVR